MRFVVGDVTFPARHRREQDKPPVHRWPSFWFGLPKSPKEFLRGGSNEKRANFVENLINPVYTIASTQIPVEYFRVKRILGDGRCLFRALAQGISRHKKLYLTATKEESEADNLRMAVQEALCTTKEMQHEFRDVIQSLDAPLPKYCRELRRIDFWGGEPELLVLSKLLRTPIHVYKKEEEFGRSGSGFIKIVEYGREAKNQRFPPVKLLYSGSNHYDLLLD